MTRSGSNRVHPAGICLTSLLILLVLVATACAASTDETSGSLSAPVSAGDDGPDWIGGTTSTGSGPADLYCSVSFGGSPPEGAVYVSLMNETGELVDSRDGMPFNFQGLQAGRYRLAVFGGATGYVSQWYGGLPVQGHDVSESQVLELKPGRNAVEFVLQPGLSIRGEVSWSQGTRLGGDIQAYDLQRRGTFRGATLQGRTTVKGTEPLLAGVGHPFLIVGLLPGHYRLGVSFEAGSGPAQIWDGGGSFEEAPVIDLTSGDVADVRVELGALPTTTTTTASAR